MSVKAKALWHGIVPHGKTSKSFRNPQIDKAEIRQDLSAKPGLGKSLSGTKVKNLKNRWETGRSVDSAFLLSPKHAVKDLITDLSDQRRPYY
jgi:hypothetical protein